MAVKKLVRNNGEIKWSVRVRENGRDSKRIQRIFDKKVEAENFLHEFQSELKKKKKDPFKTSNFEDSNFQAESEYWLNDGILRFSKSHMVRVKGILKEILPEFGNLTLNKFSPELLSQFQQVQKAKGFANSTINRKTEVITAILNHSTKHHRIPFNPSQGFKKLKSNSPEMAFWSEEEASAFLHHAEKAYPPDSPKRWVYVVYLLALNSALRAGEIWGLMPSDISPDGKKLIVKRQFNRVANDFGPTKSKKMRMVPCVPHLREELMSLIKKNQTRWDQTIFQNRKGKPICHDLFVDRQFAVDIESFGLRKIRFHDLRHTATTLLIMKGVDIKTVKEVCGHADISTTMNYIHLVASNIDRVAETFAISPFVNKKEVKELEG